MATKTFNVTAKITNRFDDEDSNLKAYASITINDSFAVYGVKVIEKEGGDLFVAMPSRAYEKGKGKKKEKAYSDICFPCTKAARKAVVDAVISAYDDDTDGDEE